MDKRQFRKVRPFDLMTESPNVSGDDRSVVLLPDPVRLWAFGTKTGSLWGGRFTGGMWLCP